MKKSIVITGVAAALITGSVAVNNLLADANSNPAAAPAPQAQIACNPCAMNNAANGEMMSGASGMSGCNPCAAQNGTMSNGSCNPCNPSAKTKNSCNPCSPW